MSQQSEQKKLSEILSLKYGKATKMLQEAKELRQKQRYIDAKTIFDEYFRKTDEYYRQYFSYSCYHMIGIQDKSDETLFKSIDKLRVQDVTKFKSEMRHLEQHQFMKTVEQKNLTLEKTIKLGIPSVIHIQIELLNLKVSFYKSIGLEKQVAQLGQKLTFSTKSQMFVIHPEHYSIFLKKAVKLKKQGHLTNAIKLLKQALNSSQNKQDKQIYYRKLAEFFKEIDKDGNEIMTCFDKAIQLSEFDKIELTRQRRVTLMQLSSFGTVDSHKGLLKYFDQNAKNADLSKLPQILIQKAIVLKGLKDFKQAFVAFNLAVEIVPKTNTGIKHHLLIQQAHFCKDIKKYKQAISCIKKADQMNPGNQKVKFHKFLRGILETSGLDHTTMQLVKTEIKNTISKYPYGSDTKRYKDQAIRMKKVGKTTQAIELLKKGIQNSTDENQQTSIFYRTLAQCLVGVDNDGHQIMNCYDKALKSSYFDKPQIQRQRKSALQKILSSGTIESHKGLLKYFDDAIKINTKKKSRYILIQKAHALKNLGDSNLAYTAFCEAVQSIPRENKNDRYHLLLQQAYFCKDIKKYKQAVICVSQADQLNPSNEKAKFLQNLLKIPNIDKQTLDMVNKQVSYTSLYYPFGCDRKHYVQRAIKLKKAGNLNQAIQLLKEGIKKSPDDDFKSKIYQKLAHFLKQKDRDGHQIMTSFDQAIALSQYEKIKLTAEKRQAFLSLCQFGNLNDHQGLAKYFDQRSKNAKPNKVTQILLEKVQFYKKLKETDRAINSYNQAIKSLKKDHLLWKGQILRQLAFYLCQNGRKQQAILTIQKAQKLSKSKNNDKIRILWLAGRHQKIQQIINKSNDPYELRTIANLMRHQVDKQIQEQKIQETDRQEYKKIIKQKYQKSISVFTKAIKMLDDFGSIRKFLQDQTLVIMKAYDLISVEQKEIKAFQKQILKEKGILKDFEQVQKIQQQSAQFNKKYKKYMSYHVNDIKYRKKNYPFYQKVINGITEKMLEKNYLTQMSIKSIVDTNQIKLNPFSIQVILHNLFSKLWQSKSYQQAIKIYQKVNFLKTQSQIVNQQQQFSVAQKVLQVKREYQAQKYENCLNLLKYFNSSLSIQESAKVTGCKNKSLDVMLQKIQAVSLWNIGRYQQATKVFSDMVFSSGKEISQFLNLRADKQEDIDCRNIVKFSSIIYSMKQKKYEKALTKMKKLESQMDDGKKMKDNKFYLMFVEASFAAGKKLKYLGNKKYLDNFCDIIQKFRLAQKISQVPKDHQARQKMTKIVNEVRQSFFDNIKKIQQKIIVFRDLHINNKQNSSTFDQMRDELQTINSYLKTNLKIVTFNIIHQPQKISNLNSLKQCWSSTCYVIYKEVVNKGVRENITKVNNLINELKEQVLEMKNDHGKQVDKDSLEKLPSVLKDIKQNYVDEFQALLGQKSKDALKKIHDTYQSIRNQLLASQTSDMSKQSVYQISKQFDELKDKHNGLNDQFSGLFDRVLKLQNNQGQGTFKKQDILKNLEEVKNSVVDSIEKRMQKSLKQINQAYKAMSDNLTLMLQKNPNSSMQNSEVTKQLIDGHMDMKDKNNYLQDMLDEAFRLTDNLNEKVDQLENVISGLQQTTQNKIGIQQIQSMLKNLKQKHIFNEITEQSRKIVKKLLSDIQQNQNKIVQLEKRIYDYVEKNISKLLDNISTILEPINDGNMDKFFKRFKDDLYLRDIKIKDLEGKLSKFVQTDIHNKVNQQVQDQLMRLNDQNIISRKNIQKINYELKLAEQKFINMANNRDLKEIKKQLIISQQKSQDLKKKLDLLQFDKFIKNYNQLLDNFDSLKSYIKLNDKKMGILSQKLGTKIVTSFNNILRNDEVTMKGTKLRFKPQKEEILLNVNDGNPQRVDVHKSIQKMQLTMPKIQNNINSFHSSRTSRNKRAKSTLKDNDLPQFIDKGRRHVGLQGQLDRKVNVLIMKDNFLKQDDKKPVRNKIKSRKS